VSGARITLRLESGEVLAEGWHRDPIAAEAEEMARERGETREVLSDGTVIERALGRLCITRPGVRIAGLT
jgi:hypothetical protein